MFTKTRRRNIWRDLLGLNKERCSSVHKTVLVAAPEIEPLLAPEAKAHLNITSSTHDDYINTLISTARRQIERYLNRALITQKWKVYYDCWKNELLIPFGNLQITADESPVVKYRNLEGTLTTLTESDYYWVVTTTDPGRIVRKYDATFPELQYGRPDAIEIAFTAGYGVTSAAIPEEIRHAMKLLITDMFEHRGQVVISDRVSKIPGYITDLIHSYKLYQF